MTTFTPLTSLLGGLFIGASASLMLMLDGRIAGISGIVGGLLPPRAGETSWRAWFVGGLLLGGALLAAVSPQVYGPSSVPLPWTLAAGLLVGFGTRLGHGCTSGHGVCGLSRWSLRSLAATLTFMGVAIGATFVVRHVLRVAR